MRVLALALLVGCSRKPPQDGAVDVADADTDTDADADTDTDADADTDTDADTDADSDTDTLTTTNTLDTADPGFGLVINEVLADPDAAVGDSNCDGAIDPEDDEFIEIVNYGSITLDLSGGTVNDLVQVRHTFPAGTVLAPGAAVVVFGAGTPTFDGSQPMAWCGPLPPGTVVQVSSTGTMAFNNSGDTLTLIGPAATVLDTMTFAGEGGENESLNRLPELDPTAPFVKHLAMPGATAPFSPGTRALGHAFTEPPDTGTP